MVNEKNAAAGAAANHANKTKFLILAGMFAAVTAVCSWINIPLPFTPVPINLALLAVYLAGGLLGVKYGFFSELIYILLGAIGVPVFAGFSGGFGIITGATGGFIIGYLFAAVLVGFLSSGTETMPAKKAVVRLALACLAGMVCCYAFGLAWFMVLTGTDLMGSLMACVFPFLPGDAAKIVLAVILIRRLKPIVNRQQ